MTRIVHAVRQYTPSVGGLEAVVSRLVREQQERGHSVRVVTLDRLFSGPEHRLPAHELVDGIPVTRLAWSGSSRYPLCPEVAWRLDDADLVHVHAIDFFFDWLALTRLFHRKPMVASTHGGFFHTAFASTLKRVWFHTVTRASATGYRCLVATSDNDGAVFRRIAGDRVTVIENGVDTDRFHDAASHARDPVLIYFGRWSANKGLVDLIELFAGLRSTDARWRLIVAGRPYDLSIDDLTRHLGRVGLRDGVELHDAPSDDALRALIGRATYFACLSRHEGFGIAAVEALGAGLFPILSDIPPFRKIVDQVPGGLLLPLGQPADTGARQVAALHARGDAWRPERRDGAIAFSRRYEWASVVDRYEGVYRDALDHARGVLPSVPA